MQPNTKLLEFSRSSNFKSVSKFFTIVAIFNAFMMFTIYLVNGTYDIKFDTYYSKYSGDSWMAPIKKITANLVDTSINSSVTVTSPILVTNPVKQNISNDKLFTEHLSQHISMQGTKNGPWYMFHELVKRTKNYKNYFNQFLSLLEE